MNDTDNLKETINKNVDMESNKQIKEIAEKDVRAKEKVIRKVSENCKNDPPEKILIMIKPVFNVILKIT